jgi:phosphoglycolate phosphatase
MPFKAILFDLDGTLIDSLPDIADCCNRLLAARGFPTHGYDAYRYFIGDGLKNLVRRALPPEARDAPMLATFAAEYHAEYARNWNVKTRVYDGINQMLQAARARGLRMSILSNKPDEFTRQCVEFYLPGHPFEIVLGASDRFPRKPDPAAALHVARSMGLRPDEFLYAGDTATDMQTAASAGMHSVGVLWGFRTADELRAAGAAALVTSPAELLERALSLHARK